ncbi:MAG TPA: ribosome biogenesis GTPase YqeH [Bacillales bacterium]|nr:ribosome biogenesis GTPase YqeH [Bacillales bacterium]
MTTESELICIGCGAPIQTENKDEIGYAPASSLEKDPVLCRRCFRLKHYGEVQDVPLNDDDYLKILNRVNETEALIVKIVDIFDFTGSWLSGIHRFAGENEVLLVGNKIDLLPKSTNQNRLKQWMQRSAKELGLKARDVYLISAQTGEGIDELAEGIEQYREGKDVYVVGSTNVGKSTFINRLLRQFSGEDDRFEITTSIFPGTTLNLIDFPLDDHSVLYDTPGVINRQQIAHLLNKKELKAITPNREIKPKIYQLDEGQTLFFAGLARLDFVQGGPRSFVCYFSNDLYIHRTRLENADALYERQAGELLSPPEKHRETLLPPLIKHDFTIRQDKIDIVFSGLGWVTVQGGRGTVSAYAPEGVGVSIRESLI